VQDEVLGGGARVAAVGVTLVAFLRIRARVSSNSDSGSPAVEIAMIWAPRLASLPRHVR
jgi:hypothetical protein